MAYGYARALNRPAVVTATEGPGVTNLATGIGAAYKGYVPVISISGAQEIWLREKDASQDIDQVTMYRPITKWAYSIPAASQDPGGAAPRLPHRARRAARAGAPRCVQGHPAREDRARADRARGLPPSSCRVLCSRPRPRRAVGHKGAAADLPRGRRRHPRRCARRAAAARRGDGDPGRDAAVSPRRLSDDASARARTARTQRLVEREPRHAAGRRGDRRRRAPRSLLDPVPLRHLQPRGEAHSPQHGRDRHRRRLSRGAGDRRLDAELHRGTHRAPQGQVGVVRRCEGAQGVGRERRKLVGSQARSDPAASRRARDARRRCQPTA